MTSVTHQEPSRQDRDAVRAFAALSVYFFIATLGVYLYSIAWVGPIPRDGSTLVVGRDFLNFWMYGRAAWSPDPGRWYDAMNYQRELATLLGPDYPGQNWSYPPTVMLLTAPFGRLDYLPALLGWSVLGLAIFLPVAWRHLADRRAWIALALSPATIFCLISGQSALLTAAMLIGIFALLDRRPLAAGVLIGLLTVKPHLGLLFPIMLIASGRWRVFAVATVTALSLAAVATLLFGPQAWVDYLLHGIPTQNLVLHDADGIATPYFPTIFMNLRGIGLSYSFAMAAQVGVGLAAMAAVFWAYRWRIAADPRHLSALFLACSIAAVPYLLSYETVALTAATLVLLAAGQLDGRGRLLARLVYWLPLIQIGLGTWHVPGPALIAPAFAGYLLLRLYRRAERGAVPQPLLQPA